MLAKEPSQGYQLRVRLDRALGPLGEAMNEGQVYVTLGRLEKAGLITYRSGGAATADRKVYELTPDGQERMQEWMSEVSWPKPDLAEFHLKLIAAARIAATADRLISMRHGAFVDETRLVGGTRGDLADSRESAAPAQTASPNGQDTASGDALPGPFLPFVHASGVAAHSGPFLGTSTTLHVGQTTGSAEVEGRSTTPSPVDQPTLITGTWVHPGSVVVEAAFASALAIHVGDQLTPGGHSFAVTGIAVTAAVPAYP
jgi:DNA-binding PadR family transcriptional regulator